MRFLNRSRQRVLGTLAWVGLAATVWSVSAPAARAETAIAGDLEVLVPIDFDNVSTGPGFGIRLGQQLHLPLLTLTPEIGFHYASFKDGPAMYLGTLGARIGIGEVLRFGVNAHFGLGHESFEIATVEISHTALTLDAGLFLDFTLLPLLDIGAHLGYGRLAGDTDKGIEAFQWLTFGLHAALII